VLGDRVLFFMDMQIGHSTIQKLRLIFGGLAEEALLPEFSYTNVTAILISIRNHHWRWVEREDFLWRHQPYFGFMLVK
jgi:hypothetical protein